MKSLSKAVGLASCCLLATVSLANAGEQTLSELELDRVTAGALLFQPPAAFNPINNQLSPGGLLGPPSPPPPVTPPPPITPPTNQLTVSDGGARATVTVPISNATGSIEVLIGASSGPGNSLAEAGLTGNITGGPNASFQSGGSGTNISFQQ